MFTKILVGLQVACFVALLWFVLIGGLFWFPAFALGVVSCSLMMAVMEWRHRQWW